MTFLRYPTYKDSGVAWLGEIPAHWTVNRIKHVCALVYGDALTEDVRVNGDVHVFGSNGPIGLHNEANTSAPVIVVGRKGSHGKVTLSQKEAFVIDTAYYIDERYTKCDIYWLYYTLLSLNLDSVSQDTGVPGLSREKAYGTHLSLPPLPEQRTIAAFLDTETTRIDTLVAKQEALIATLQEKRRALISHVVTKGLDPAAPMKDSGVPWLGEVPKHWEVTHLKRIARIRYGLGQPPREHDQGVPLIRATNIDAGKITECDLVLVDPTDVPESKDAFLTAGEIIVVRSGAYTGDSSIIPSAYEGAVAGYDMVVTVVRAIPQFVAWSFLGTSVAYQFDIAKLRAAQPHLNAEELGETWVVLPTTTEQHAIVTHIEKETSHIDTLIAKAQEMIAVLREHRTALVAAAVTGQIDVRGV